jgi:hypothetical protein
MRGAIASGVGLSLIVAGLAAGCGDDETSGGGGAAAGGAAPTSSSGATSEGGAGTGGAAGVGGGSADGPTFYGEVAWVLHDRCLHCHSDGQIGGFSLEEYEDAAPLSGLIVDKTQSGEMPPFHAVETDDCEQIHPWKDDPRLTPEEIALFAAWDAAGAPAGDPADGPPPYDVPSTALPGATIVLTPEDPFTVAGESDLFECFIYDPALEELSYADGIHFVAGNGEVAHHALTFKIPRSDALALSGGGDRFPCFGNPPGELVHAWAPGGQPFDLPEGVGVPLSPDDVFVVQVHYHPVGGEEQDASTLEVRLADERPTYAFQVALIGNARSAADGLLPGPNDGADPEFLIPAGAEGHTEEMVFQIPAEVPIDIPILFVANHMHYVGTDMRFSIERAAPGDQPAEECLVRTPAWDFNWQRFYEYDLAIDQLPTATAGDVIRARCTYDNTLGNPFVRAALEARGLAEPVDVRLGEQTLDEMCLGALGILLPNLN